MKNIRHRIPGFVILLLLLVLGGVFAGILVRTQLIPGKLLAVLFAALLLVIAVAYLLSMDARRKVRFTVGAVLAVLLAVLLCAGSFFVSSGRSFLDSLINSGDGEVVNVSVYVKQDDPAQSINETAGYTFGILSNLDRESTDNALAQISDALGTELQVMEYANLIDLVDALLHEGEIQAMVMNSAFVDMIADMEGYEDIETAIRELHIETVEKGPENTPEPSDPPVADSDDGSVFSVYVSGIDSRTGLVKYSRSDVNILITVNTKTRQILMISTPRDFYVEHPASEGYKDKLTNAGIYGVENSMGALAALYDTDVEYYFRVNFSGFEDIIDALGGITVYSDYEFTTYGTDFHFVKGENVLNGAQALAFARERKSFASGDRQRGKNQMKVIKAVIEKAVSPALLTNYTAILDSVAGSFDTNVTYDMIASLVRMQLDEGGSWNIVSYSVTGGDTYDKPYSQKGNAYVMVPDMDTVNHAIELIRQVENGEILTQE